MMSYRLFEIFNLGPVGAMDVYYTTQVLHEQQTERRFTHSHLLSDTHEEIGRLRRLTDSIRRGLVPRNHRCVVSENG